MAQKQTHKPITGDVNRWSAKRSGAAMRLEGTDEAGQPVKITVSEIVLRAGGPVAIIRSDYDKDRVISLARCF